MSFQPTASIDMLRKRAALTTRLREFFASENYWEAETPLWSRDTCVDAWIDPVPCSIESLGEGFLQTSPEFHLKRLLASGADQVWSLTRSFRNGEVGDQHNPEFSIVEWYRVGDTHEQAMAFTERLVRSVAAGNLFEPPNESFPVVRYYDAFHSVLGIRIETYDAQDLEVVAVEHAPAVRGPLDRDGWLNALLAECVEPWLATFPAVFLTDYPASQAALAKVREPDDLCDAPVAERFELYLGGVEIANGYHELTDATELRSRFESQNQKRLAAGKAALPIDSQLMAAMEHGLPDCAGVALGWDRLVMTCLGCECLGEVMAFPRDRA